VRPSADPARTFQTAYFITLATMSGAHPNGVKPSGNQFWLSGEEPQSHVLSRSNGLGGFARVSDELVLQVLEMLEARDLVRFSGSSRVAHIFAFHEPLWQDLYLHHLADHPRLPLNFGESWIDAARNISLLKCSATPRIASQGEDMPYEHGTNATRYDGKRYTFFSDALHRPWQCATAEIDPTWLEVDNVKRHSASELSVEDFVQNFEKPCVPVVLTQGTEGWAAGSKWSKYFGTAALEGAQDKDMEPALCRVGPLDMKLGEYLQ
jgi:hypothetical protein